MRTNIFSYAVNSQIWRHYDGLGPTALHSRKILLEE